MNDVIANRIASFCARLTCLDKEAHVAIWQNQAPLKFTAKVTEARTLTAALITRSAQQSAPVTGNATSKRKEEEELENEAHKLGRAVASYARDGRNHALAEKYDLPISTWRRLRDEALIQRPPLSPRRLDRVWSPMPPCRVGNPPRAHFSFQAPRPAFRASRSRDSRWDLKWR